MTIREQLNTIAEERIIILDGAMGSVIKTLNLDEKSYRGDRFAGHHVPLFGCHDLLCLTRPGAIGAIHDTYLEAGADIIETCSFKSNSISLSDYGLSHMAYELSKAAAHLARKSVDKFFTYGKPRFVAGSIGPTTKSASILPNVSDPSKHSIYWDELEAAYYENARGLLDGGVDIFLVESVFDTLNAKAALFAISRLLDERKIDVPVMISAAIDESGRLLSGQSIETFCISVLHANPWSIGLNCSFPAAKLFPHVRFLSDIIPCHVSVHPNAGTPNQFGHYNENPDTMASSFNPYFKEEIVNVVGGCCGTTPGHIAEITMQAFQFKPRKTKSDLLNNTFSGLEPYYTINNAIFINELIHSNDDKVFKKALTDGEYEDAADIARNMIERGESILNIELNNEASLCAFLDYALLNPYIAKVPFMLTSSDFKILIAGLKRIQGRGLAGPVNLKHGDAGFLARIKLIQRYGAVAFVSMEDEQGAAETKERAIEIENRINKILEENNFPVDGIVIDLEYEPGTTVDEWQDEKFPDVNL